MPLKPRRAELSKHQKFLNHGNRLLVIVSTLQIFTAFILMFFYHLPTLSFWTPYFSTTPITIVALGLYTLAVSVYMKIIKNKESRLCILLIVVCLSISFLVQVWSSFSALELRKQISTERAPVTWMHQNMALYGEDALVTHRWDKLQRDFRCCGGMHYEYGYIDWANVPSMRKRDVPDSCCHNIDEGCGRDKLAISVNIVSLTNIGIWKDGCLEILQVKLKGEVAVILMVYAGIGVFIAVLELSMVMVACAYAIMISKKKRGMKLFSRSATANDEEGMPSLRSDYSSLPFHKEL